MTILPPSLTSRTAPPHFFHPVTETEVELLNAAADHVVALKIEILQELVIDIQDKLILQAGERGGNGVGIEKRPEQVACLGQIHIGLVQLQGPLANPFFKHFLGLLELLLASLEGRDVNKGDDNPFDPILRGAERTEAEHIPAIARGFYLALHRREPAQNLLGILHKAVVLQSVGEMADRPAAIAGHDVDDIAHARRKTLNAKRAIQEKRADIRGAQQVFQLLVGARDLVQLSFHLVVYGLQLFVDRLQLFLAGFQLLGGRSILLIDGLQLLVGSLHLLIGTVEFLHGDLHLLA